MKKLVIIQKTEDKKYTLYDFIYCNYPKFNDRNIRRNIRLEKILVNGKPSSPEQILYPNDKVLFDVCDDFFTFNPSLDFLNVDGLIDVAYEDENILVVNKPKGILCQPDKNEKINTLLNKVRKYLYDCGDYKINENSFYEPSLSNQLDFNTSGLVIASKNINALRIINKKIADREIRKFYICEVNKLPQNSSGILKNYLRKDFSNNKVFIYDSKIKDSVEVSLYYKIIETTSNAKLLEIELYSGKSHQIRAQLSKIGCPILGDHKYGNCSNKKINSQCLTAYKIIFDFKTDSGILDYLNNLCIKL